MYQIYPNELKDWSIDTLDKLIPLSNIENEKFDFKGHHFDGFKDLYADICAMANTSGGYLVLGVDEKKDAQGRVLYYIKKGFKSLKHESEVENRINNALAEVEPIPKMEKRLDIVDGTSFYPILKIISEDIEKPFFARGICYVRVNSSSMPASRTTVMNLFNNLIQKKTDIQKLRVCSNMLIEQIQFISKRIRDINTREQYERIIPVNLEYLKNSIISTDWFFIVNDLYGGNISGSSTKSGLYTTLNKIEGLNLYIDNYNREFDHKNRDNIKKIIQYWEPSREEVDIVLIYFKSIVMKCDEFLSKISR